MKGKSKRRVLMPLSTRHRLRHRRRFRRRRRCRHRRRRRRRRRHLPRHRQVRERRCRQHLRRPTAAGATAAAATATTAVTAADVRTRPQCLGEARLEHRHLRSQRGDLGGKSVGCGPRLEALHARALLVELAREPGGRRANFRELRAQASLHGIKRWLDGEINWREQRSISHQYCTVT